MGANEDGVVYRRADGIVLIDPDKAVGRHDIVDNCPYGAVFWNEANNLPQKCTLCAHLLDNGRREPRCVEACPTQVFGDRDDPLSEISISEGRGGAEPLHPEYGTRPLVAYRGLPKRFVAGEIVLADQPHVPAHGVALTLRHGNEVSALTTDSFGDFEFNGLSPQAEYTLSVVHPGYRRREFILASEADLNLGLIELQPLDPNAGSGKLRGRAIRKIRC